MSWDADLVCDSCGHPLRNWNYTHNTNRMANAALDPSYDTSISVGQEILGIGGPRVDGSWWQQLDGMTGPDGAALLTRILDAMSADPDRFKAMNPDNGWGDYDSFTAVLVEMREAVPETPTTWKVSG